MPESICIEKQEFRNNGNFSSHAGQMSTPTVNCFLRRSPTHFEDLSNEIIYELFEYLDIFDIFDAFFNLNIRFRTLLTHSHFPIKLQISSIAKSDFDYYYSKLITVHSRRIVSLRITNELIYDLPLSPHYLLPDLVRLKTLVLENLHSKYLQQILNDVASLCGLQTLAIKCVDHVPDVNRYFLQIFQLRALKYCKIFMMNYSRSDLLPFANVERSPIERLIIQHPISIQHIARLLSYIPQLRILSLEHLLDNDSFVFDQRILVPHITHLSLRIDRFSFAKFEIFIKYLCVKLQVLYLSAYGEEEFFNPLRWEALIASSMPLLRILHIDLRGYLRGTIVSGLDQFRSSFWIDRKWFLFHEGCRGKDWYSIRLYSINPFPERSYQFHWSKNLYMDPHRMKINMKHVHHLCLLGQRAIHRCQHKFFNATELTLGRITSTNFIVDVIALQKLVRFDILTILEITSPDYPFQHLVQLLSSMHALHTLKIRRIRWSNETDVMTFRHSHLFHFVSNVNRIQTLSITDLTDVNEVRLLFTLCPRLQYFTILKEHRHALAITRMLVSQLGGIAQYLILLSLRINNVKRLDSLKLFIESKECLQHCCLKVQKDRVYLWR